MKIYENRENIPFWHSVDHLAHKYLGAHRIDSSAVGDGTSWCFRVWAPAAKAVYVTGDFCGWEPCAHRMVRASKNGIWEIIIEGLKRYDAYKYVIRTQAGELIYKADPYANHFSTRPDTASKLFDISEFKWNDTHYMQKRAKTKLFGRPLNIYEMHLGSWRTFSDGSPFSFEKLADELIDYVVDMGYTHIEIMPVSEYPFDGSWGYQVSGYFAPTSRYGTPYDFMKFVDLCHQNGIGVIMDWVPAHFPRDEAGLFEFDGQCCYEHSDPLRRDHPEWGTRIFDFGKREVASFLLSCAWHWFDKYHIDGIRVDAVASMLYLDYGKKAGEWRPNEFGDNRNLEAVEFLKLLNTVLHRDFAGIMTIAEESTSWPLVSAPVPDGGLGFDFKWNMGWMNDTLSYISQPPKYRGELQSRMSFSTSYAYSENFILPLSHDEVVHGKGSLVTKMPGEYDEKFDGLRAYLAYMYTHPGKKLIFMGGEFAQFAEWSEKHELDWKLLDYPSHRMFREYVKALNHLYLREKSLFAMDERPEGFSWISADDNENSVFAYRRIDKSGNELIVVLNFSDKTLENYRIGVPYQGRYTLLLSSDAPEFGGHCGHGRKIKADAGYMHGFDYNISLRLAPLSAAIYKKGIKSLENKQKALR